MARGKFISLEGLDGAGKSTHLAWLTALLTQRGIDHIVSREPGGTPLGEKLRTLLLNDEMDLETEALLMFAVRREHLAHLIEPALAAGRWVVCDRFTDATYAYQVGGRGLAVEKFAVLEQWVQGRQDGLLQPDLTLLFDVPLEVSRARLAGGRVLDRFEREQDAFFERVRHAYHVRASSSAGRIKVIDATRTLDFIQDELAQIFAKLEQG
ncbi:dTMP kinase [Chitinimonas sp. BJB300]|uniref:dTMP kinase n=1 Tax=Chitinimonas sp. BJB300 TaxID=1559339 RepID=UPI000C0F6BBF|nr:dTMP kinase [Chitinimonas sp. BJB300]PHV11726.1 dTMP kinase [Chitinimonas sp. BJB300]TSJ90003.1 dTMP kinase [Chitinimonas sp. BJB300]